MKYYPINEDAARRAKEANSFRDYQEGSATKKYQQMVDRAMALAEEQKSRVDVMYHEKIDRLLDTYCRKLAENMNASYSIEARVPSILVAGGSNFPVRKKEKQNAARDRNLEEWNQIQQLLDKIRNVGTGGISSDDPRAIEKLKVKLDALIKNQERMKAANAAIRIKDQAKGDAKLAEMGYGTEDIAKLREPDFCGRIGYPAFVLSNNNANIRRIRSRIEELEKRSKSTQEGWKFGGGEVVVNTENNRLQILFEERPDEALRLELKSRGFRWAPSQGAWQRQLTDNAFRAIRQIPQLQKVEDDECD